MRPLSIRASLLILALLPGLAGAEDIRVDKQKVESTVKYTLGITGLKRLGKTSSFGDKFGSQSISAQGEGKEIWSLSFEINLERHQTLNGAQKDKFGFMTDVAFHPRWFDVSWADVPPPNDKCEVLGWLRDGEGKLMGPAFAFGTAFTGKGNLIFTGAVTGKKLSVQFLTGHFEVAVPN
jgi:hypothetical protein